MQTASFTGFVKAIFWIITTYYIIKFLTKLFLPIVAKKVVEKATEQFKNQQQSYNNPNQPQQNHTKDAKPKETKKVGEYIDFEEIE